MTTLSLTDPRLRLTARGDELRVEHAGEVVHKVPVHHITEVMVFGNAVIAPAARNLLLRQSTPTVYLTADGRYRGQLVGPVIAWPARRVAQYALQTQPDRLLAVGRGLVAAKLTSQHRMLAVRNRRPQDPAVRTTQADLLRSIEALDTAADLDAVRGIEGMAARRYFASLSALIKHPDFTFTRRTRNPPRDPVNACLSFGYALLQSRVLAAVQRGGLDPYLGALHGHLRGAPSAVLDLMEPYRPRVDAMVLTLLNRRALQPTDFERPPPGAVAEADADSAVYLGREGRRVLITGWSGLRMGVRLPGDGETALLDRALDHEVSALRRFLEGDTPAYTPWLKEAP